MRLLHVQGIGLTNGFGLDLKWADTTIVLSEPIIRSRYTICRALRMSVPCGDSVSSTTLAVTSNFSLVSV